MKSATRYAVVAVAALSFTACKDRAKEAQEAAMREAALEAKRKAATIEVAEKINPPVANHARVSCDKLIDAAKFTTALDEKLPLQVVDVSSGNAEATATCSLVRGGVPPTPAEQAALLKKNPRLGVLPGDEVCRVAAYCWTLESEEHLRKRCGELKNQDDDTTGGYACVQISAVGADDIKSFRFVDADTKCRFDIKGGPSLIDNDLIAKCARIARDSIGTEQLVPETETPTP
ncbi:MAG: hypothetical protein KBG15_23250 [Kofleriaceae bacterium]|nr:hypothetical protein [Kofleriaceae bacterium]